MRLKEGFRRYNGKYQFECYHCESCSRTLYTREDPMYFREKECPGTFSCEACATEDECKECGFTLLPEDFPVHKKGYCIGCAVSKGMCNGYCKTKKPCAKCAGKEDPKEVVSFASGPIETSSFFYDEYASFKEFKLDLEIPKKGGKLMSTLNKIKNLAKSKDQKLFEKYHIFDGCGELTAEAKDIVLEKAFEAHKDEILADLKKLDAEEKK